jgi:hypothetical protein
MRCGDTCVLCGDAILDVNEIVRPSAYPWNLLCVDGISHRDCANDAVANAIMGQQAAEDAYAEAMGWPDV